MTREDWSKYKRHLQPSTTCPVCGKHIEAFDESVTYVKSRTGSHIFIHEKCAGLKGGKQ